MWGLHHRCTLAYETPTTARSGESFRLNPEFPAVSGEPRSRRKSSRQHGPRAAAEARVFQAMSDTLAEKITPLCEELVALVSEDIDNGKRFLVGSATTIRPYMVERCESTVELFARAPRRALRAMFCCVGEFPERRVGEE